MRPALAMTLVAASVVAGGCAIDGRDDEAAYRRVLDGGRAPPVPPKAGEKLDLGTAMRLASARDESLAVDGEAYARALIDRRRAAAAFLPSVSLSPRYFARERLERNDPGRRSFDVPVEASMDLNPVADAAGLRVADLSAEALREFLLVARDDLLLTVGRTHYAVLKAERQAAVLRASLEVQEAHVEDARARLEAGMQRPLAVALAESRAADAKAELIDAETIARNGRTALSFLTGWDVGATELAEASDPPADTRSIDEAVAAALLARPEIRAAERAVDAAAAGVEEALGERWPSVSLDLARFLARDTEPTELDWTALLQVNLPIFRAGLIEADIRDALSRAREAKLRLSRARRAVRSELEAARQTLASSASRIEALNVRLDASRRGLELAQAQWTAGLATWLERLTAQDDLLAVQLDLASAELERKELQLILLRAAGRIDAFAGLAAQREGGDASPR